MTIRVRFVKMSGAGNDFVVVDEIRQEIHCDKSKLAVSLCAQHTGIGADGALFIEPSEKADFFMRYYNADGSYGGMCGNGGRCAARYAYLAGFAHAVMTFEALDYIYTARIVKTNVSLRMKDPSFIQSRSVRVADRKIDGVFIDTGSPHFITETADLDGYDVVHDGKHIRFAAAFAPNGCNANFVELLDDTTARIRTYERGVEAETMACGTGCVAAAVALAQKYNLPSPVRLKVRSGEELRVYFQRANDRFTHVYLEGSAHVLFTGIVTYDTETNALVDSPDCVE